MVLIPSVNRDADRIGIGVAVFRRLSSVYRRRWNIPLCVARLDGSIVMGKGDSAANNAVRRLAIDEALRWGEPAVEPGLDGSLVWAVPLMHNATVLGGLVARIAEVRVFPAGNMMPEVDIRTACGDLRRLAEEENLTNGALLEMRRNESIRERERAEAIHAFKTESRYDMRAAYLLDEPMLLAAIRKGDRGQARAILNRLLVGMIHRAGDHLDLVKSYFMELVVMLYRTAVEAGGGAEELLGANFASISELSRIKNDEELARWLHDMLERIMDSLGRHRKKTSPAMLSMALKYMAERCCQDISRDEVAAEAYMSPSHFSRFFKKHLNQSFTDVLNQMRIDRAAELLAKSERDLKIIALETGFADQSYFTKVFRKLRGVTPANYRRQAREREGLE